VGLSTSDSDDVEPSREYSVTSDGEPVYLVWIEPGMYVYERRRLFTLDELRSMHDLELIRKFPEGAIYRVDEPRR
jgi:hypothetical protein